MQLIYTSNAQLFGIWLMCMLKINSNKIWMSSAYMKTDVALAKDISNRGYVLSESGELLWFCCMGGPSSQGQRQDKSKVPGRSRGQCPLMEVMGEELLCRGQGAKPSEADVILMLKWR